MCIRFARLLKITMYINTHSSCQTFFSPTRHCFVATFRCRCVPRQNHSLLTAYWFPCSELYRYMSDIFRISARIHRNLSDVNHMCLCLAVWQFDGNGDGNGTRRQTNWQFGWIGPELFSIFFEHCRCNKLIHIRQWKQNVVDISCESIGFSLFNVFAVGIGARRPGDRD